MPSRQRLSQLRHPERNEARAAVQNAVRIGVLIRPDSCSRCLAKCKPHGHHDDYSKPLAVTWLCGKCHIEEHKGRSAERSKRYPRTAITDSAQRSGIPRYVVGKHRRYCDGCGGPLRAADTIALFLKECGPASETEIGNATTLGEDFVEAYLNVLRDRGQVRQVKRGVWAITKAASR